MLHTRFISTCDSLVRINYFPRGWKNTPFPSLPAEAGGGGGYGRALSKLCAVYEHVLVVVVGGGLKMGGRREELHLKGM